MAAPKGYSLATLKDHLGHDFGSSKPMKMTQHRINTFADATGDYQWIHTNPEMAKKHSPFGGTVAHGFLSLSFVAGAMATTGIVPKEAKGVVNYGCDDVRFLSPVLTGSEVVASYVLKDVQPKGKDQQLISVEATVSVPGAPKPALVGTFLALV
ncbi:MAG: MaoC family dehydratase, partial [Planktomarina sp.]